MRLVLFFDNSNIMWSIDNKERWPNMNWNAISRLDLARGIVFDIICLFVYFTYKIETFLNNQTVASCHKVVKYNYTELKTNLKTEIDGGLLCWMWLREVLIVFWISQRLQLFWSVLKKFSQFGSIHWWFLVQMWTLQTQIFGDFYRKKRWDESWLLYYLNCASDRRK